jgi:hypothetical protein
MTQLDERVGLLCAQRLVDGVGHDGRAVALEVLDDAPDEVAIAPRPGRLDRR